MRDLDGTDRAAAARHRDRRRRARLLTRDHRIEDPYRRRDEHLAGDVRVLGRPENEAGEACPDDLGRGLKLGLGQVGAGGSEEAGDDLARPPADYGLPAQLKTTWYSVARPAQVVRRDPAYVAVFQGGEIPLGADWPTVEWMLRQRVFSLEDAAARQTGLDRGELQRDLEKLVRAGVLAETEMR